MERYDNFKTFILEEDTLHIEVPVIFLEIHIHDGHVALKSLPRDPDDLEGFPVQLEGGPNYLRIAAESAGEPRRAGALTTVLLPAIAPRLPGGTDLPGSRASARSRTPSSFVSAPFSQSRARGSPVQNA